MTVQSLPLPIDFTVYAGTSFRRQFRWLPDGNTAQDFTGWSATMLIGPQHGTAVLTLDTGEAGGVDLSDSTITLSISVAQGNALPAGSAFHVLDITDPDGFSTRFLRGRLLVVHDVAA